MLTAFHGGFRTDYFAGHECRETKVTASVPVFSKQQAPRPRLMIRSFSQTCLRPETRPGLSGWTSHGECGYVSKLAQIDPNSSNRM